jgi:Na+:H+ antiporter, NhaA family
MSLKINLLKIAKSEIFSGLLMMLVCFFAIFISNFDAFSETYKEFVFFPVVFGYGDFVYKTHFRAIVNDGLMTFFFLLIGLELKFHLVCGEYKDRKTLILPTAAAVGGIVIPAFIYLLFNFDTDTAKGWAIPIATDTAFVLAILSFFGRVIPNNLRAFIISFSLIDDAIALLILAVFYTQSPNVWALLFTFLLVIVLIVLNRCHIRNSVAYMLVGTFLWGAMVGSGIHGTLCGAVLALAIPVEFNGKISASFHRLESTLRPLVHFLILPLFIFLNSGVDFETFSLNILMSDVSLGIVLGLFLGKQIGVSLFSYLLIKLRLCSLPSNVKVADFYAVSILSGIGFTLSLFIGDLTFDESGPHYAMRAAVIIGSLFSAILGTGVLMWSHRKKT